MHDQLVVDRGRAKAESKLSKDQKINWDDLVNRVPLSCYASHFGSLGTHTLQANHVPRGSPKEATSFSGYSHVTSLALCGFPSLPLCLPALPRACTLPSSPRN